MTVDEKLIYFWAEKVRDGLVQKTMQFLQQQKDLTSGDDTCLENNWEEYCVQVQDEESVAWAAYMDHIEMLFRGYFEELSQTEQLTLWLYSEEGGDWYYDKEKDGDYTDGQAPIVFESCAQDLKSALADLAMDYSNENIERYLHRFEEDYDVEVEDEIELTMGVQ